MFCKFILNEGFRGAIPLDHNDNNAKNSALYFKKYNLKLIFVYLISLIVNFNVAL